MRRIGLVIALWLGFSGLSFGAPDAHDAETRYPIVLVHGMFGFDSLMGVLDYWYKIPDYLERHGAEVHVIRVNALDNNEARGEELLAIVQQIVAATGKGKVNLVGHSQGALTSRYVASVRPDLVASVISVSGPHKGSKVADFILSRLNEGGIAAWAAVRLVNLGAAIMNRISKSKVDKKPDFLASLKALNSKDMIEFNQRYPEGLPDERCSPMAALAGNGVRYYSFAGIEPRSNFMDAFDAFFFWTGKLVFGSEQNDGLVSRCSSHLGEVIRDDLSMNHLDTVNLLYGLVDTDPLPVYLNVAASLKSKGL